METCWTQILYNNNNLICFDYYRVKHAVKLFVSYIKRIIISIKTIPHYLVIFLCFIKVTNEVKISNHIKQGKGEYKVLGKSETI